MEIYGVFVLNSSNILISADTISSPVKDTYILVHVT